MKLRERTIGRTLVWLVSASGLLSTALFAAEDNFNDNVKDATKWGNDVQIGGGVLTEKNQRLEYTCAKAGSTGETYRPWIVEKFSVTNDWSIQVDTFNNSSSLAFGQVNSGGFTLLHPTQGNSEIYLELYAAPFGFPVNKGFVANLLTGGAGIGEADTGQLAGNEAVSGAVRMEYNGATKVVTCFYDLNTADGYQWAEFASYGLAGAGGATDNTNWGLTDGQQFSVWVYGYSSVHVVTSGQLYLDNFVTSGGSAGGGGGPSPVPTGTFNFGFPIGNPFLAAIASIMGNYTGVDPFGSGRTYNIDVAQDDAGKVTSLGTVDGIANAQGGNDLNGPVGAVTTVNNEPTLNLTGSFTGTGDGLPSTAKYNASGPAGLTDIGGGTNGAALTATMAAQKDGVPHNVNNAPIVIPATPDMEANFRKKNWILQLNINNTVVNGKDVTTATAELTLPTGDVVQFPERKVKYSATKGFKLKFKKGMNVMASPPRVDRSSISITGLTFQKQGDDWVPTGGVIAYRMLGQLGVGNLLDFTGP